MKITSLYRLAVVYALSSVSLFSGQISDRDYKHLMGSDTPLWSFVSDHDLKYLKILEGDYVSKIERVSSESKENIPKILHFIWMGPKSFPEESLKNIHSWIKFNPTYRVFFWTDYERPLPHPSMETKLIRDFSFQFLKEAFESSDNFGEKSDLLRYEILYQMGGIYVDHDVECFKDMDALIQPFEIVCGIEPPHQPLGDTSINVCNNLIAAAPGHMVLRNCIQYTQDRWNEIGQYFHGKDVQSITKRVFYRSFSSFDQAVKEALVSKDKSVFVLPSLYFNSLGQERGLYAHHSYASTWFESEAPFEKSTRLKLMKITKKLNQIFQLLAGIVIINIATFVIQIRNARKKSFSQNNRARNQT